MISQSTIGTESNELRVGTLASRMTAEELLAVKAAAKNGGISCSEWLRAAALAYLQEPNKTSDTPIESIILKELMGLRFLLVNLYAGATPGVALQTVHQIMAHADGAKHEAAEVVRRQALKWRPGFMSL
jgi:hypothetical protein